MKKTFITSLLLLAFVSLKAQDIFFSLYRQNHVFLNPAAAGAEDTHAFSLSGRDQADIYKMAMLTYDQPIKKISSGIGVVAMYDKTGDNFTYYYGALCYKYRIKLTDKMHLAIGAEASFTRRTIDAGEFFFANQFTGTGFTPTSIYFKPVNYMDIDAGVWYSWSNWYVGVSVKHLTQPNLSFLADGTPDRLYSNYILTSGYTWKFSKHFSMIPSTLIMVQGPGIIAEVDDEISLKDTYSLGGGVRLTNDNTALNNIYALKVCGGINFKKKIQLTLAYDFMEPWTNIPKYDYLFGSPNDGNWYGLEANIKYRF